MNYEQHKAKISAALMGHLCSQDTRQKISRNSALGFTAEGRARISHAMSTRIVSAATRQKMSDSGRKLTPISEETRLKIKLAAKANAALPSHVNFGQIKTPKINQQQKDQNNERSST